MCVVQELVVGEHVSQTRACGHQHFLSRSIAYVTKSAHGKRKNQQEFMRMPCAAMLRICTKKILFFSAQANADMSKL